MEILVTLLSTMGGAIIGSVATWYLITVSERNKARCEALVSAAQTLQHCRVVYANWYVEYLSPHAKEASGHWAKDVTGKPDPVYIEMMSAVDNNRGQLRIDKAVILARVPHKCAKPICDGIAGILDLTGRGSDCREVDLVIEEVCERIYDVMKQYSKVFVLL